MRVRYRRIVAVVKSQAILPSQLAAPSASVSANLSAVPEADAGKPPRTGIVVVHGIGSQQPAETLLQWTAPLIEVLTAWRALDREDDRRSFPPPEKGRPDDPVKAAAIDFHSPFPTISLHIPETELDGRRHPAREWLITEAWWASNVAPPGLATMINWLGPGGGAARVVDGILGNKGEGSVLLFARAILVPIVSVIAGLVLSLCALLVSARSYIGGRS